MQAIARCKVCHRPMSNPAHIAAGMGPVCAAKLAASAALSGARAAVVEAQRQARVAADAKYARIVLGMQRCEQMLAERRATLRRAERFGSDDEVAYWAVEVQLAEHWLARILRMVRAADAARRTTWRPATAA